LARNVAFSFRNAAFSASKTPNVPSDRSTARSMTESARLSSRGDQAAGSARAVLAHYFNVDAIDAAAGRVQAGGGQIRSGSMEVPGGLWIVQCRDPQGAVFCLVAPRR
jgi:predicted enzyme related to lactoylglutathione lyase